MAKSLFFKSGSFSEIKISGTLVSQVLGMKADLLFFCFFFFFQQKYDPGKEVELYHTKCILFS